MLKKIVLLTLSFVTCSQTYAVTAEKSLWHGSIKFPSHVNPIPPVRIYYTGTKIPTEIDEKKHEISFALSEYSTHQTFYLIIVDTVDFVAEQNTVKYLKVPQGRPYKIYRLTFVPNKEIIRGNQLEIDLDQQGNWEIVQMRLAEDLRIPDNAIIVCYHSYLIKNVEGGNALELPRIIIDAQMLSQLTADELQDASVQFLLASLNCDSFHTLPDARIKADVQHKTIITLTT